MDYVELQRTLIAQLHDPASSRLEAEHMQARGGEPTSSLLPYDRALFDGFATQDESKRAAHTAMRALRDILDPPDRIVPLDAPLAEELLGFHGSTQFAALAERIDAHIARAADPSARRVGTILSWIAGPDAAGTGANGSQQTGTYSAHVDKANRDHYDISALLYLSTRGEDFEGGCLAFHDADRDRLVSPKAGLLLTFCSGRNLHAVQPVTQGNRLVLSCWYEVPRRSQRNSEQQ